MTLKFDTKIGENIYEIYYEYCPEILPCEEYCRGCAEEFSLLKIVEDGTTLITEIFPVSLINHINSLIEDNIDSRKEACQLSSEDF